MLFKSCADAYGDGAHGLRCIKQAGGLARVQDPAQAAYPTMPQAALDLAQPDFVLPLAGLRAVLVRLGSRS